MTLSRRRFLGISAAAAGLALLPLRAGAREDAVIWRGRALGAPAQLILHHHDRAEADRLVRRVVAEIDRLEGVFSLYRPDSALSELNRAGVLAVPAPDLVALLRRSRDFWQITDGAFDPSVQPLWELHARHHARPNADPAGPRPDEIRQALSRVGFGRVILGDDRIVLSGDGMGLTLNGIAQGYITDRAIEILRAGGITRTLADLGEIRALGQRNDGSAWTVGIENDPGRVVEVEDRAVATSSPSGFRFAGLDSPSHMFDPETGASPGSYDSVTVLAADATTADALSTGFSFMTRKRIAEVLQSLPGVDVLLNAS